MPGPDAISTQSKTLQRAADILKTVAHPIRLLIIDALENSARSVSELCASLGTSQPYMSQQLTLMKDRGVLNSRRDGKRVLYSVADSGILDVIHCVLRHSGDGAGTTEKTDAGWS